MKKFKKKKQTGRDWYNHVDYTKKLSPDELTFLRQFELDYAGGSPVMSTSAAEKKACYARRNSSGRDVMNRRSYFITPLTDIKLLR